MMMLPVSFLSFMCLFFLKTNNWASARLALNQSMSPTSASTQNTTFSMYPNVIVTVSPTSSPSPPFPESLVVMGTLYGVSKDYGFARSLSLSYNGDMLAVGSPFHATDRRMYGVGLVQVYQHQNGAKWRKFGLGVKGESNGDQAGSSVSLSGDGKWLAVGAPRPYSDRTGYVKIVEVGTSKVFKLDGDNNSFGQSVSLSHNGSRMAIVTKGYVRIYEFQDDWVPLGEDLPSSLYHTTVTLSRDGDFVAVGDSTKDQVRVYKWKGSQWEKVGGNITGNKYDRFGYSLDISQNGKRIIIGTDGRNYVEVYEFDGEWKLVGDKLKGHGHFGRSVSISDHGYRVIIGSPYVGYYKGRVNAYQYHDMEWKQIENEILGENKYDRFGYSVSMSGNGDYIAIGATRGDSGQGLNIGINVGSVSVFKIE